MKSMTFKYFLNGIETRKELIDWNRASSVTSKGKDKEEIHVKYLSYLLDKDKPKSNCGMSTRHKACNSHYVNVIPRIDYEAVNREFGYKMLPEDEYKVLGALEGNIYIDNMNKDILVEGNKIPIGYKESEGKTSMELDFNFVTQMAERMKANKKNGKYEPWNWKKPMDVRELAEATMRHCIEVIEGRYEDDGRPFGHLEALATNSMMINYQLKNNR